MATGTIGRKDDEAETGVVGRGHRDIETLKEGERRKTREKL